MLTWGGLRGGISVALALTERGELAADPEIDLIGIPERGRGGELLADVAYDAALETFETMPRARRRDLEELVSESALQSNDGAARSARHTQPHRVRPIEGRSARLA